MKNYSLIFEKKETLSGIDRIAQSVYETLAAHSKPFCLTYHGQLGAGKTTLTGLVLKKWGLDKRIPVTSPTYTYFNEYCLNGSDTLFAHMDFYRLNQPMTCEDLGFNLERNYRGLFIEWPDKVSDLSIVPTHMMKISISEKNLREYSFYLVADKLL